MTKNEFLSEFQSTLNREAAVTPEMDLMDIEEFDSLAELSIIALFDTAFGLKITADQIRNCDNVADIIALAGDKIN